MVTSPLAGYEDAVAEGRAKAVAASRRGFDALVDVCASRHEVVPV